MQLWTANMQRINNAQVLSNYDIPMKQLSKMSLEINPSNRIIQSLKIHVKNNNDGPKVTNLVWILYSTALIDAGYPLEKPHQFTRRIHSLVSFGIEQKTENTELLKIEEEILRKDREKIAVKKIVDVMDDMEEVD